ncbi:hypothetical protein M3Y94_01219300 [Aphelenchoides besseyi]|nr:hypothetical protein M3Y94_01219300 [Aphelenchoides besseyi]
MKFLFVGLYVLFLGSRTSATPWDEEYGCIIRNQTAIYYDNCRNITEVYIEWSKEQTIYFLINAVVERGQKVDLYIDDCEFEFERGNLDGTLRIDLSYASQDNEPFGVQMTTTGRAFSIGSSPVPLCDQTNFLNETAQGNWYAKIMTDVSDDVKSFSMTIKSDSDVPPREFDPSTNNQTDKQANNRHTATTNSAAIDLIHFFVVSLIAVILVSC